MGLVFLAWNALLEIFFSQGDSSQCDNPMQHGMPKPIQ